MDSPGPGARILGGLTVLALLSGSQTALAHPTGPLRDLHAHASAIGYPLPIGPIAIGLVVALMLATGAGLIRLVARHLLGRALALALTLAVSVLTLESAVHSVHHLGDPESAAACAVLVGSHHLSWAEGDDPPAAEPVARVCALPLGPTNDVSLAPRQRLQWGRAPPA